MIELRELAREIEMLEDELDIKTLPADHLQMGALLADKLTKCTWLWIERLRGCAQEDTRACEIGDWWMKLLFTFEASFEPWAEMIFLTWGQHSLPDLIAEIMDGTLEQVFEDAFYDLYRVLPRVECQDRLAFLQQKRHRLIEEGDAPPVPHRPRRFGTANGRERILTGQRVPSLYEHQAEWLDAIRAVKWHDVPSMTLLPLYQRLRDRPHFFIVHLFSGRRRHGDFHCSIDLWARARNVTATVLSMDTAVSVTYGNLSCHSVSWAELVRCYESGHVSGTLAGTPCETFSEARFQPCPPAADGAAATERRWPRPLRSYARLLGLQHLTQRELAQLHAGSSFFMQGLLLMAYQLVHGGIFVSEHPAPPRDDQRPSIWTSPWVTLLRQHPDVHLHIVPQWPFGAEVPKPTGLLAMRLPLFLRSLYRHADREAVRPNAVAIGRHNDGTFRTSKHKEYPSRFCAGLAQAFTDHFDKCLRTGVCTVPADPVDEKLSCWIHEATMACKDIRADTTWLPDYQPF